MKRLMATASLVLDPSNFETPTSWDDTLWGSNDLLAAPNESIRATFMPLHYEAGYAYPLLVWLHDEDSNESVLPNVMQHVSTRNHLATSPRGTVTNDSGNFGWDQSAQGIADAEQAVINAIEETAEHFNVHPDRVFIAGTGSGGTMALRLALRRPEWFAGCTSFDGAMPVGERPLSRIDAVRETPLMLSIREGSTTYSETQLCTDLRLLHSAGCEVGVRHYQGDGDLRSTMLEDLNRWMMDIVLG